jgi:hypothetical protein
MFYILHELLDEGGPQRSDPTGRFPASLGAWTAMLRLAPIMREQDRAIAEKSGLRLQ